MPNYQSDPPLLLGGVVSDGLSAGGVGRVTDGWLLGGGSLDGGLEAGGLVASGGDVLPGLVPGVVGVEPPDWPEGPVCPADGCSGTNGSCFCAGCSAGAVFVGGLAAGDSLSPLLPAKKYQPAAATTNKTAAKAIQRPAEPEATG